MFKQPRIATGFFAALALSLCFSSPVSAATKIMPLGDSITDGVGYPNGGGYRVRLWDLLLSDRIDADFVGSASNGPTPLVDRNHEGHSGWRIDQLDSNIVNWLNNTQPQVVLLHIGTNDIGQNFDVPNAPARLSALIDKITATAPNAFVVVAKIIPTTNAANNVKFTTFNNAIPGIVSSKVAAGKKVSMVDMNSVVLLSDLNDGLHPNVVGYGKMADVWHTEVKRLVYGYDNKGTSLDASPTQGNLDALGSSYSKDALAAAGFSSEGLFNFGGMSFKLPKIGDQAKDNITASGEVIQLPDAAYGTRLGILGAANHGPSSGTATITYADNSTQTFTLGFSDWTLNAGAATPLAGTQSAVQMAYRNTPSGKQTINTHIFFTSVPITAGKAVKSLTLPAAVNQGGLHVFSVATDGIGFHANNIGISNDANAAPASFDTGGYSYSNEQLKAAGFVPNQNVVVNGTTFRWPTAGGNVHDNVVANGQTIFPTSTSGTRIAFLGSASFGPSQGTATLNFTDGTSQTFTLGFSDWALNGGSATPLAGTSIAVTSSRRNNASGAQTLNTHIFYKSFTFTQGKTVKSVTLPTGITAGQLHVFAVAVN